MKKGKKYFVLATCRNKHFLEAVCFFLLWRGSDKGNVGKEENTAKVEKKWIQALLHKKEAFKEHKEKNKCALVLRTKFGRDERRRLNLI